MIDGDCPLARLCAEAERLIVRREAAEEEMRRLHPAREATALRAAERAFEEATRSLDNIVGRASDHRPASRTGALFAVALAAAEAELLAQPDLERHDDHLARLRRRLFALRHYLEEEPRTPAPRTPEPVARFYMPRTQDPFDALASPSL
ncbi:hypothetical protein [Salinarimonas ramus]|uniref:Uncharacterized protein n=1 Tax=Salinarimonas ramus TaxID=690164 RepID=A0A917Q5T2_9HYPH|nr:hypothetical protein [Salinarimonas ramus]GGK27526.1 hypothetical protein GCM10011322_12590 [Salinarimonas ramus]